MIAKAASLFADLKKQAIYTVWLRKGNADNRGGVGIFQDMDTISPDLPSHINRLGILKSCPCYSIPLYASHLSYRE